MEIWASTVLTGQSPSADKDYVKCSITVTKWILCWYCFLTLGYLISVKFVGQTFWQWSLLTCRLLSCAWTIVWRSSNNISTEKQIWAVLHHVSSWSGLCKGLKQTVGWFDLLSGSDGAKQSYRFTKIIRLYNKKENQGNVSQKLSVHIHLEKVYLAKIKILCRVDWTLAVFTCTATNQTTA